MIVGTAGHIDHGKTALVKALTGTDADRLAEEKARGITIELGFAYADLGGGKVTGFVDVPGHERFVHTMLAGVGGIDLALLVIAADDGIMPQTLEHLAILDLLDVSGAIVALTKSDLVGPERIAAREQEIAALLAPTHFAGAPVIAVSSLSGAGIAELRDALAAAEARVAARARAGRFRMAVDRSFVLGGAGVVVTGTVLSGEVAVGDHILISPSQLPARVRGIHMQNRKSDTGFAGQRCALNLAGEEISRDVITRGDVVMDPSLHAPSQRLDIRLRLLASEPKPVITWTPARLHIGAAEVGARIVPLGGPLHPGEAGLVQLVLDQPVAATAGDHLILRDVSARRTMGGGRVIDPHGPPRKRARPERLAQLVAAEHADPAEALAALAQSPAALVDLPVFLRDRALTAAQGAALLEQTGLILLDQIAVTRHSRDALQAESAALLAAHHGENPDLQGMAREALRLRLVPRLPQPAFMALMRAEAASGRIVLDGSFLRLPDHKPRLSTDDEALYTRIAQELGGETRFRPPRVRDFATTSGNDEAEVRRILRMAARQGRVDLVARDHFFLRATTIEMAAIIRRLGAASETGWFTAPTFRDEVNNGRKVAIEILDFFDRHGLTLRRGDLRRVNPHRIDLFSAEEPVP